MRTYKTITEIKRHNKEIGRHFFDRDAMICFNSKIESGVIRGRYFITSEIDLMNEKKYSVRMCIDGRIEDVGGYHYWNTKQGAEGFIKELPKYFPEAFELARSEFNGREPAGAFINQALIEPANRKDNGYDPTTFTGACSWICKNADVIRLSWLEGLSKEFYSQLNWDKL